MPSGGTRTALFIVGLLGRTFVASVVRADGEDESRALRGVLVHIDSPRPVDLELATGEKRNPYSFACRSPCDEEVPAAGTYRIAGNGVRPSPRFQLPDTRSDVLKVRPSSEIGFDIGIASIVVGGIASLVGSLGVFSSSFAETSDGGGSGNGRTVAFALLGGGLAMATAGSILVALHGPSEVRETYVPLGGLPPPPRQRDAAWSDGRRRENAASSRWIFPLVEAHF